MTGSQWKIITALACDDVRREDNGKLIVIGCYGSGIRPAVYPALLPFAFVVIADFTEPGDFDFEFRLLLPSKSKGPSGKGVLHIEKAEHGVLLPIGQLPAQIDGPGTMKFQHNVGAGRWRTIQTWRLDPAIAAANMAPALSSSTTV